MKKEELKKILSEKKLIIFDLDGTLINSIPYHAKAFVEVAKAHGISVSQNEMESMMGMPSVKIFSYLQKNYNLKGKISDLRNERRKIFYKIVNKNIIFPGILSALKYLRKKYTITLATGSSYKSYIMSTKSEMRKLFHFSSTIDDVKHGKPSPEQMLFVLKKLKMLKKKSEVLVLGDSFYDSIAAKSAGLDFIGVRTGFKKGKPLEKYKNLMIIDSVAELSKLL